MKKSTQAQRPEWVADVLQERSLSWFKCRCKVQSEGDCMEWSNKIFSFILTRSKQDQWQLNPANAVFELVHGHEVPRGWLARCSDGHARCLHPDHLRLVRLGSWQKGRAHSMPRRIRAAAARRAMHGTTPEHIATARDRTLTVREAMAATGKPAHFIYKQRSLHMRARRSMGVAL